MKKIIALTVLVLSGFVVAQVATSNERITQIHFWKGNTGVLVRHENMINPDECPGGHRYYILPESHPHFEEIYSLLLAAHMADQPVQFIVDGCIENYPEIRHIYSVK